VINSENALSQQVDYRAIDQFIALKSGRASPRPSSPSSSERPDIIVIQSESFFDPITLNGIESTEDLLPNLHRAEALGYGGTMKVPTFGGGTLRTEFEVLAGVPMAAIPELKFPYLQLHSKVLPSIVKVAHDNGYRAIAVHPNDPSFWNRKNAFRAMGFDAFYSKEDFPANVKKDGLYISDEAMTSKIINILDDASKPTFLMAISIEAHGPYGSSRVANEAVKKKIPVPTSWPEPAVNEYQSYAYHIHHADRQLGRLWNYLEARNTPFVLIFYGDHLPGLPKVYRASGGFKNHVGATKQEVPWLLITDKLAPTAQPKNIYSWMIGGQALCAAGIRPPNYYALLNRADAELSNQGATGQQSTVLEGINALSILRLRSKPLPESAIAAAARSGCFVTDAGAVHDDAP
jgi:phosphoglycerol transferase MdoB-like AlkP superfamily enzyme